MDNQDNHDLGHIITSASNIRDTQDKIAIMQAYLRGEIIEMTTARGDRNEHWVVEHNPTWNWGPMLYRVKLEEVTYDTMDWTNIDVKYRYAARDECGDVYLYKHKPKCHRTSWWENHWDEFSHNLSDFFLGHVKGTCDWKDSLINRNDSEQKMIDEYLRQGHKITAILKYRNQGGHRDGHPIRSLREAKDAVEARQQYLGL